MNKLTLIIAIATTFCACKNDEDKNEAPSNVPLSISGEWDINGEYTLWLQPGAGTGEWESNNSFGIYSYNYSKGHYQYRNDSLIIYISVQKGFPPMIIYDSIRPSNDNTFFNCRIADTYGVQLHRGLKCKFTRIR